MRHSRSSPDRIRLPSHFAAATAIVSFVLVAWANALNAPFVFDDLHSVTENPTLRGFWRFAWLVPSAAIGETVGGRPFLNFTFALNYALGGVDVRGYHLVNLVIHVAAALTLLSLMRRLVAVHTRLDATRAGLFALAATLLWAVHPLQTSAVTYISQRAESLAAFFCLLTFYAFLRSLSSTRPRWWLATSITAVWLGVLTKETAVVAPLLVALYDVKFTSGSWRAAWTRNRLLYSGFLVAWAVAVLLVATNPGRGGSAGFGSAVEPWIYLVTQFHAIVLYLRQAVWPDRLVFDYGTGTISSLLSIPLDCLLLTALVGLSVFGLLGGRRCGFIGMCFFLLLAPSSSIVPISTQTMAEHRMYLPLVVPTLIAAWALVRGTIRYPIWVPAGGLGILALALVSATIARNSVYDSATTLWEDTVRKAPDNPRAFNNLGIALMDAGQVADAKVAFGRAIELQPNHAFARYNLATLLLRESRWEEAAAQLQAALSAAPRDASIHLGLALALDRLGRKEEAGHHYEAALNLDPSLVDARLNLAALLRERGQINEAVRLLSELDTRTSDLPETHYQWGLTYDRQGDGQSALREFRRAIQLRPDWAEAYLALGNVQNHQGASAEAEASYRDAARLDPASSDAHFALGSLLAGREAFDAAITELGAALSLNPGHVQARANLGNCLLVTGRIREAITAYEEVLKVQPDNRAVRQNLELARELQKNGLPEASLR